MKLSPDGIKPLISGAVRFLEDENGVMPIRFTPEQSKWYQRFPGFADKVCAGAGMRLDFETDAREIRLSYTTYSGSSRKFCFFDVYLDRIPVQHCGTENREEHPDGVLLLKTDGAGHRVTIYLPNLSGVLIREMDLQSASFIKPVKKSRKLLAYGDSITQGYDAHYPSFSYINRVADHFDMELINKAVGGDRFTPEVGAFQEEFTPDHIFVAYGTNDWACKKKEAFHSDTRGFFGNLRKNFPDTPIHVLLPIWRGDCDSESFVGKFEYVGEFITRVCSEYDDIQIINGFVLFPRITSFFDDHFLHPGDTGFLLMADNVIRELEKKITNIP